MTDSDENNLTNQQHMNPEVFARLLEALSTDPEEANNSYMSLHGKLTNFFAMKGIPDPVNCADEAMDRAALKISSGKDVPDVYKYCFGIARNLVKEKSRFMLRESTAFQQFIEALNNSTDEQIERIRNLLKPCFDRLDEEDRQLLAEYCQDIQGRHRTEHRRKLAEKMNISVLALRVRVTRLRKNLADCVQKRSKKI
jgi:hypothetical protein